MASRIAQTLRGFPFFGYDAEARFGEARGGIGQLMTVHSIKAKIFVRFFFFFFSHCGRYNWLFRSTRSATTHELTTLKCCLENRNTQVHVSQLQETQEVSTGLDSLQGYELYDLVMLGPNEVGVITRVNREVQHPIIIIEYGFSKVVVVIAFVFSELFLILYSSNSGRWNLDASAASPCI